MKIIKTHWMTRREWVAKHEPGRVDAAFCAGVEGCPENYVFTDASSDGCNSRGWMDCKSCFERPAKVGGKYILVREEEE